MTHCVVSPEPVFGNKDNSGPKANVVIFYQASRHEITFIKIYVEKLKITKVNTQITSVIVQASTPICFISTIIGLHSCLKLEPNNHC